MITLTTRRLEAEGTAPAGSEDCPSELRSQPDDVGEMLEVDWWFTLKERIVGRKAGQRQGRESDRKDPRLPSFILALCSVDGKSAFAVEISSLSVSGLKMRSARPLPVDATIDLRVEVGRNFEHRDTTEIIGFKARTVWCRKRARGDGFEAGVRYVEHDHEKRDKWITLVLQTYGMSLGDDRRLRGPRHEVHLPVTMSNGEGVQLEGGVQNLSLGGMLASFGDRSLQPHESVRIEMRPHGIGGRLELNGRVVSVRDSRQDGIYLYGVAFDELDGDQRENMLNAVLRISREAATSAGHPGSS